MPTDASPRHSTRFPALVLFDLDGTLLDSAPDMLATVNRMRAARDVEPMALAQLRPHVSRGARAMCAAAFPGLDVQLDSALIGEFLGIYRDELGRHGAPFDGVAELLEAIEADGARWGIVTNKPVALARDLMPLLGWESRCAILLGGDSLPARKPDPLPLLHAADACGTAIADCAYVGDDARDIIAARAAAMRSVVALWGYRLPTDEPTAWGGDLLVDAPRDLLEPAAWPSRPA